MELQAVTAPQDPIARLRELLAILSAPSVTMAQAYRFLHVKRRLAELGYTQDEARAAIAEIERLGK